MIDPAHFPYGGVPVYNPQSLNKEEALAQFHARKGTYQSLMRLLGEEQPSHVLIIGVRGMGKTTLLQRVRYGVEDDVGLSRRYLVLVFPEEQYNVNQLHRFFLNTVDALADAVERLGNKEMVARVEEQVDVLGRLSQAEIEERVPKFLSDVTTDLNIGLLLLVDNADRLFDTIREQEQWRLRELLSTHRELTLFGATTQASDGIYGPDRAFFEFFKIYQLPPLSFEEVRELLLQLSASVREEGEKGTARRRVEEWLAADSGRLRTLVQLTGGNPRTTVLLFHLVLDGLAGGAREYLEHLLDQCTPNYKGRVDELPPQSQQVLDAVALRWDPVTAMEVGQDTGLETNVVSTQLTRLVRQGILEKADPGDRKKALYQVAERFFNIWYLMRASRRVRAKLRWFVEFLRVIFDSPELDKMAWDRLKLFRAAQNANPAEIEMAFACAFASGVDRRKFENYLQTECGDREKDWRPFLESVRDPPPADLFAEQGSGGKIADKIAELRKAVQADSENAMHWQRLGRVLCQRPEGLQEAEAAFRKAIQLDPNSDQAWSLLAHLLEQTPERTSEAELALQRAIEIDPKFGGYWANLGNVLEKLRRTQEAETAFRKAIELDETQAVPWAALGLLLFRTPERRREAELAFRGAIAIDSKVAGFWLGLAFVLFDQPDRASEAETALRRATELDPRSAVSWSRLGALLCRAAGREPEAEEALRKSIEIDATLAGSWQRLGGLLANLPDRFDDAEAAFRAAIELCPEPLHWSDLGRFLSHVPGRIQEAEAALRKAIEIDPHSPTFWSNLGQVLADVPKRAVEAELAFRRAIDLDPTVCRFWTELGWLLSIMPGRIDEAEVCLRKAIECHPDGATHWNSLGFLLASRLKKPCEAEEALRKAVEIEPDNPGFLRNLGVLLYCETSAPEEATQYLKKASQLSSSDLISAAILFSCNRESESDTEQLSWILNASHNTAFWTELLELSENYRPFAKILLGICDLVESREITNPPAHLCRAVALAQLGDFPRASVVFEDALGSDPIEQLSLGKRALEVFFAAAVRSGRVRDCIELLEKKQWTDAWRPIYEALKAVEYGSTEYLKRVAVEIRDTALVILRRIAPDLPEVSR